MKLRRISVYFFLTLTICVIVFIHFNKTDTFITEPIALKLMTPFMENALINNTFCTNLGLLTVTERLKQYPGVLVNISGQVDCVLQDFNKITGLFREKHLALSSMFSALKTNKNAARYSAIGSPANSQTDYFETLAKYPQVSTILLHWQSLQDNKMAACDLPVKRFYKADRNLVQPCTVQNKGTPECSRHLNASKVLASYDIPPHGFYDFSNERLRQGSIAKEPHIYLHIVHNSYIDDIGNVASGDLDIIPFQCQATHTKRDFSNNTPHFEEVFTIAQFWGEAFYHKYIEDLPRLIPFLDFLHENLHIKIHLSKNNLPLEIFNIGEYYFLAP